MKGNISNWIKSEEKRPQRRIILLVFVVVVIIVVLLLSLRQCSLHTQTTEDITSTDSVLPTIRFNGNDGYNSGGSKSGSNGMKLQAVSGLVLKQGELEQNVKFANYKDNKFAFRLSMYLSDGTLLYESDYVNPGSELRHIKMSKGLNAGLYSNALLVYRVYSTDDAHTEITQCEFPMEIRVQ